MTDVGGSGDSLGEPTDGDNAPAAGQLGQERSRRVDFRCRRRAIRSPRPGVGRDDVPEQGLLVEPELGQHAVDDRRARLGRAGSRELALGREGDAADPRSAITGGLPDEEQERVGTRLEVRGEPLAQVRRVRVLVERRADARCSEPIYQRSQWTTSSSVRRRCVMRDDERDALGSGRPLRAFRAR
jgi:hypothetical protein